MMRWNDFSKKKPTENGWYICTVEVEGQQRYIMDLYWYNDTQRFKDNRVQNVFDMYDVRGYQDKRLYNNELCDRTKGVVAWMKTPKPFMKGFVKTE